MTASLKKNKDDSHSLFHPDFIVMLAASNNKCERRVSQENVKQLAGWWIT